MKLKLLEIYDDEDDIYVINASGGKEEKIDKVKLFEMDYSNIKYDHLTSIFIESVKEKKAKEIKTLPNTNDFINIEDILSEKIINMLFFVSLLEKSEIYSIGDIVNTAFYKLNNLKKELKIKQ